jgi:hypothetical protein
LQRRNDAADTGFMPVVYRRRLMRLRLLLPVAGLAVLLAPASASAAGSACTALPATVSLSSSDPTVLRDDPSAIVRARDGARLDDVRVTLTRRGHRYATGLLTGRLARGRIAIPLRLDAGRRIGAGAYRLVVSASRAGCGRHTSARTWRFGTPSLPVRAAPVSTLVSDNRGGVKLLLRSVDRQEVSGVRVSLLDAGGATVAQTTHAGSFDGQISVDLPLAGPLPAGAYTLRVTGRSAGAASVTEQKLAFGAGSSDAATTTTVATTGLIAQHATVDWSGGAWQGRDVAGFVAPGIGYGEIVCRPDAQWIRFYPNDLGREVSMMNWTYKDWSQNTEKAIREALHTQYTGKDFREGLNKFGPAEKLSTGEFDGIISDRGPFAAPAPTDLAAPTTLKLTWQWDFSQSGAERCHVDATFLTQSLASDAPPLARSGSLAWRGSDAAPGHDSTAFAVPGVGTVTVTCSAAPLGARSVTVDAPQGGTVTTREGSDDTARPQDMGPVAADLPNNGMLFVTLADGTRLVVSSRWKVNDPDPTQNSCFVAAQAIVGA